MHRTSSVDRTHRCNASLCVNFWCSIFLAVVLYSAVYINLHNILWNSYKETSCVIVNSSVVSKHCCGQHSSQSSYDTVWTLNVRSMDLNATEYLADIREPFSNYYLAYKNSLTSYPVSIN
ncbi:hypothetical protein I4U23_015166 [Adineta vaga]|nr:hypothetical protein I4U23_015166 [Adineta vaga]